jgi:hypothetical protein
LSLPWGAAACRVYHWGRCSLRSRWSLKIEIRGSVRFEYFFQKNLLPKYFIFFQICVHAPDDLLHL